MAYEFAVMAPGNLRKFHAPLAAHELPVQVDANW